jgi:acetate CoA/acetoacetate CoA-transferase alpha subunit
LLDPQQDREGVSNQQAAIMKSVTVEDAVDMIPHGASIMIGGFMGVGTPERIIDELVRQVKRDLLVVANDTATPSRGIGKLVSAGLICRSLDLI